MRIGLGLVLNFGDLQELHYDPYQFVKICNCIKFND